MRFNWQPRNPFEGNWISNYDWKRDFAVDGIAGASLSSIVVPQSMAYATLAGLEPKYGLYASIVPVIVYSIFGTSRHLSLGTIESTRG